MALGAVVLVTQLAVTSSVAARDLRRHHCAAGVTYAAVSRTAPRVVTVTVQSAIVRRRPGADCPRVALVRRRTRLQATGARAKAAGLIWFEVKGMFGSGWLSASAVGSGDPELLVHRSGSR